MLYQNFKLNGGARIGQRPNSEKKNPKKGNNFFLTIIKIIIKKFISINDFQLSTFDCAEAQFAVGTH